MTRRLDGKTGLVDGLSSRDSLLFSPGVHLSLTEELQKIKHTYVTEESGPAKILAGIKPEAKREFGMTIGGVGRLNASAFSDWIGTNQDRFVLI